MRVLWIGIVVAATSCERAHPDADPMQLPMPKVTVKLLDPGREPRVPLRIDAPAGAKATFRLTSQTELPGRTITTTETYDTEVMAIGHGEIHTRQTVRNVTIVPAPKSLDPGAMIGTTLDTWHDARGAHLRRSVMRTRLSDYDPQDTRIELLAIAPEEMVGVGARWHEDIQYGAATASVDGELLSRDGDRHSWRITYRSERHRAKWPATIEGSAIVEVVAGQVDGSVHGSNTVILHGPHGDLRGSETFDVVGVRP